MANNDPIRGEIAMQSGQVGRCNFAIIDHLNPCSYFKTALEVP